MLKCVYSLVQNSSDENSHDFALLVAFDDYTELQIRMVNFVREHSDSKSKYTEEDIIRMPEFHFRGLRRKGFSNR